MKRKLQIINVFVIVYLLVIACCFAVYDIWIDYKARNNYISPIIVQPTQIPSMTPIHEKSYSIHTTIPYWEQDKAFNAIREHGSKFKYLSLFWYTLADNRKIVPYKDAVEDTSIISFAKQNNIKVMALITNLPDFEDSDWDSDRVRKIISTKQNRTAHIRDIVTLLDSKGFDGVNIDYEELDDDLRNEFSLFIEELAAELHKRNKLVSVAIHPKSTEYLPAEDNGSRAQDWVTLARHADHLYFMTYGEHWSTSTSGPIASIPWDTKIIMYAKSLSLPMEKVYLGMPLYALRWQDGTRRGEGLTFADVKNLENKYGVKQDWNDVWKSPSIRYRENNRNYTVWFENARSIKEKVTFAEKMGVGGLTFWYFGDEDPEVWNAF